MHFFDLDIEELRALIDTWGEPAYRADQIWRGVYQNLFSSPTQFTSLPRSTRNRMENVLDLASLKQIRMLDSRDRKSTKTVFSLNDGSLIEAVLMRYDNRQTLCISTQVGCAMGCVFCATGQMGFRRHLTSGEIVAQVIYYARLLQGESKHVSNVVLMGMGEPFHNYDNSMAAIDRLNDPLGYNLGARRFTVSTVGIVPMIRRFADEKRQVNLAISLHAAEDEVRTNMLPVNKRWGISEILDACKYYVAQTGRRVTFEWALIHDVNDLPSVSQRLAARLKGLLCHVNLIPLNPTTGYPGLPSSKDRAAMFKSILEKAGIPCTIRVRRGIDINAGCGQLSGIKIDQTQMDYNWAEI